MFKKNIYCCFSDNYVISQKNSKKTKKYYLCGGEMAERSNAAVLKTVDLLPRIRGFESLFLRQLKTSPRKRGFLFSDDRIRLA